MNVKAMLQLGLVRLGSMIKFEHYVEKNCLEDSVFDVLINDKKYDYLIAYAIKQKLTEDQVTKVLARNVVDELAFTVIKNQDLTEKQVTAILKRDLGSAFVDDLMLAVVKLNVLTDEQQEIVISKNNVLLLECYLSPYGYFDINRRFSRAAEYKFIQSAIKADRPYCLEIFKTYIDNFFRTLWTEELFDLVLQYEDNFAVKHIFHRARLPKDLEERFVVEAPDDLLKYYFEEFALGTDSASMLLVEHRLDIAKIHYDKYKLRGKSQEQYFQLRQQLSQSDRCLDDEEE